MAAAVRPLLRNRVLGPHFGVLVTDGITKALETGPITLQASLERFLAGGSPADVCDDLSRAAAAGPGPAGVADWQDDRTVFVFAVEPSV